MLSLSQVLDDGMQKTAPWRIDESTEPTPVNAWINIVFSQHYRITLARLMTDIDNQYKIKDVKLTFSDGTQMHEIPVSLKCKKV